MKKLILVVGIVTGSIVLPVSVSAAAKPQPFSLTLYPARLIVPAETPAISLNLLNSGTDSQRVNVTAGQPWLVPETSAFDLAPGVSRPTRIAIRLPAAHDSGDLDATVAFSVQAPQGASGSPIKVSRGVAATIILETGIGVHSGLTWDHLTVPLFADPMTGPVALSVMAHNTGNVHQTLDPVFGRAAGFYPLEPITKQHSPAIQFESTVLLRDQARTLRALWNPPPIFVGSVGVRGQSADVVVFPLRAILGALLLLIGLVSLAQILQRRRKTPATTTTTAGVK